MASRPVTSEDLIAYLVQAAGRACLVFRERAPADPAHALALGEAVALFNLADEFGLIAEVRRRLDDELGRDAYRGLSEAMKAYYLGVSSPPARPPAPPRDGPGASSATRSVRPGGGPPPSRPPRRPPPPRGR